MRLFEKCNCGAVFEAEDEQLKWVQHGSCKANEHGERFVIQRELRLFREAHRLCLGYVTQD